jgi:hypothetical protein
MHSSLGCRLAGHGRTARIIPNPPTAFKRNIWQFAAASATRIFALK